MSRKRMFDGPSRAGGRRRRIAFRAAAIALPAFLLVVIPEIALRLFWRPSAKEMPAVGTGRFVDWLGNLSVKGRDPRELYMEDSLLLWRLRPGARIESFNYFHAASGERQPIRITINEDGYRGPAAPKAKTAGELRVLCMGDSNFFGYPLDDARAFPAALQGALEKALAGGPCRVVNGGVPGYTVLQGWRAYEGKFRALKPDVLLLSFANNDAWEQPRSDAQIFARAGSISGRAAMLLRHAALIRWMQAMRGSSAPWEGLKPRVSLDEYADGYRRFFAAAREDHCRVVVMDYRAPEGYAPYSERLKALCKAEGVEYLFVKEEVFRAAKAELHLSKYREQYEMAVRRWGDAELKSKPFLACYAEPVPEHLNEAGAAFMADRIAAMIAKDEASQ